LMNEINGAAAGINVELLVGHTEVTGAVTRMVVSTTAIGRGPVNGYVTSSGAKAGDYIVATKFAGLEGTSIIANDYEEYLKDKLSREEIKTAKDFIDMISVVKEGVIGGKLGATSMHDATEGGLLGAVWEIAESSGKGFEIYEDNIPMKPETINICSILKINPLKLISSGMMIITTEDKDVLLQALAVENINASCIGRIVEDRERRVIISGGTEKNIEPPQTDELFNIKLED
jgi:hydrogenase expression/formation protein HypE